MDNTFDVIFVSKVEDIIGYYGIICYVHIFIIKYKYITFQST